MKNPFPKKIHDVFEPFIYPTTTKTNLIVTVDSEEKEFLEVLKTRESNAFLTTPPINSLYKILYNSCKIREIGLDDYGYLVSKRMAPSAGGRHPIDILVSIPTNKSLNRSLQYYNPIDNTLGVLEISSEVTNAFFSEINETIKIDNAALIWFSIQTLKTQTKYHNPDSLYWRDSGALLYCIQLFSTYFNLASCPIGTLATSSFKELFNNDQIISGGGILIGESAHFASK